MNNDVYNIDYTRLLPEPLKNDASILALGKTIANELQENIRLARFALIYPRIDELDERTLDILARDFHVDWYDDTYPIEAKRAVIKSSIRIHKRLGTKFAVVMAIGDIFPKSEVQEWFEYGGKPYHFRLSIYGGSSNNLKKLYPKIQYAKNLRSVMDDITFIIPDNATTIYAGTKEAAYSKQVGTKISYNDESVFSVTTSLNVAAFRCASTKRLSAKVTYNEYSQ